MMAGNLGEPPTMNEVYSLPGRNQHPVGLDAEGDPGEPTVRDIRPSLRSGLDAGGISLDWDLTSKLSPDHRWMLFEESGIDPHIAAERGYVSVRRASDVPEEFRKDYQRRPGLSIPMYSPAKRSGKDSTSNPVSRISQMRPDVPRKNRRGKAIKYETPSGAAITVDVHPRNLEAVKDSSRDLWITEGVKKGDALASLGLCAVSLIGVWMFAVAGTNGKELLPCFDHIALKDRRVFVVFDSDVMTKPEVNRALERLVAALEKRGAIVRVVYLPDIGNGKTGVDDYLSAGHTLEDLEGFAQRFEPSEFSKVRLAKDERLRLTFEDAESRMRMIPFKGMGGKGARDLALAILARAARSGKMVGDGLSVPAPWGPLQIEAGMGSSRTVGRAFRYLEACGFGYRDNKDLKPGEAGRFVVRAKVKHFDEEPRPKVKESFSDEAYDQSTLPPRTPKDIREVVPSLRWSKPARKGLRGTVKGTRKVRQGPKPEAQDRIIRLGKSRGAVIDELVMSGGGDRFAPHCGGLYLEELAALLNMKRPRDLRRRTLPMLEEFGIIRVEDDFVSLTEDWQERLEYARETGGEIEAEKVARTRLKVRQKAYRKRLETKPTPHWTQTPEASGAVGDLERVEDIVSRGLSEEDRYALEAIQAFEEKHGRRSFKWNQSGSKELFYSVKPGVWPEPDQLDRIREYLDALRSSKRSAA